MKNFPFFLVIFLIMTEVDNGKLIPSVGREGMSAKTRAHKDPADIIPYSERVDHKRVPAPNHFIIERHVPTQFDTPYHHHTSVEINFLEDCEMVYTFSGRPARLPPGCLTVFWGAAPHRVTSVSQNGLITNIYLSLGQFMRWSLPRNLTEAVLTGCVISAPSDQLVDKLLFDRIFRERDETGGPWRRIHLQEIETRLRRLALTGWSTLISADQAPTHIRTEARSMLYVEGMLRFIADNFTRQTSVADIAASVNLSQSHAALLFREIMGVSVKTHLIRTRLSHARMLLSETENKIVTVAMDSGFSSLSRFYDAFQAANGCSPAHYRKDIRSIKR